MTAVDVPNGKPPRGLAAVVTAVDNPGKLKGAALVGAGLPKESDPEIPKVVAGAANVKPVCVVVTFGVPNISPVDGATEVVGVPNASPVDVPNDSPDCAIVVAGVPKVNPVAVVAGGPNDRPVCPAGVAALPNEIPPVCPTVGVPNESPVGVDILLKVSPVGAAEGTDIPNDKPVVWPAGLPNNPVAGCEVAAAPNDKPEDNVVGVPNVDVVPNKLPEDNGAVVVPSVNPDVVVLE